VSKFKEWKQGRPQKYNNCLNKKINKKNKHKKSGSSIKWTVSSRIRKKSQDRILKFISLHKMVKDKSIPSIISKRIVLPLLR